MEKLSKCFDKRLVVLNKKYKDGRFHVRKQAWEKAFEGEYQIGDVKTDIKKLCSVLHKEYMKSPSGTMYPMTEKEYLNHFYKESLVILDYSYSKWFQRGMYIAMVLTTVFVITIVS